MPEREIEALLEQTRAIRAEASELRLATQEFAETLRRGLVRATVQGIILTFAAVVIAVSFLGYLTGKSWTCDPTALKSGSVGYWICDKAFPQTTQQARFLDESRKANAAVAQLVVDLKQGLETQKRQDDVLHEIDQRLNPGKPSDLSVGAKRTCEILRKLVPTSPSLEGCP